MPLRSVAFHHRRKQIEARFVQKHQFPAFLTGLFLQSRPSVRSPSFNFALISLGRPSNRLLGSPTQLFKNSCDMRFVVQDSKLPLDHDSYARTGPDISAKSVGFGTMPKKFRNLLLLSRRKPSWPSRWSMMVQGIRSAFTGQTDPLTHGSFGNPQAFRYPSLQPAPSLQIPRLKPTFLSPIA